MNTSMPSELSSCSGFYTYQLPSLCLLKDPLGFNEIVYVKPLRAPGVAHRILVATGRVSGWRVLPCTAQQGLPPGKGVYPPQNWSLPPSHPVSLVLLIFLLCVEGLVSLPSFLGPLPSFLPPPLPPCLAQSLPASGWKLLQLTLCL